MPAHHPPVLDLLDLEEVGEGQYRNRVLFEWPHRLYGGQVAAQALLAAGMTVPEGRHPHSLHSYFLREGASDQPTLFQVARDRDGRSFSARRVTATQGGKVIFTLSASFAAPRDGIDQDVGPAPEVPPADEGAPVWHSFSQSLEVREAGADIPVGRFPPRFWIRSTDDIPASPLLHACVLAYASDLSTGLAEVAGKSAIAGPTLDHALWFHRPILADDWMLVDLAPRVVAGGRGWYDGTCYDAKGALLASLTQEMLLASVP